MNDRDDALANKAIDDNHRQGALFEQFGLSTFERYDVDLTNPTFHPMLPEKLNGRGPIEL